jgi:hypothetical protein
LAHADQAMLLKTCAAERKNSFSRAFFLLSFYQAGKSFREP